IGAALVVGEMDGAGSSVASFNDAAFAVGEMDGLGVASTSLVGASSGIAVGEMDGTGIAIASFVGVAASSETIAQLLKGNPTEAQINALIKAGYGGTSHKEYSPTGYPVKPEPQAKTPEPTIKIPTVRARRARARFEGEGDAAASFGAGVRSRARADAAQSQPAADFHGGARASGTLFTMGMSTILVDADVLFTRAYLARAAEQAAAQATNTARADADARVEQVRRDAEQAAAGP